MVKEEIVITGKARAIKDIYNFKFYVEQQWSDGEWRRNDKWPVFNTVIEAKEHFERAKIVRRETPALLGDLNDA